MGRIGWPRSGPRHALPLLLAHNELRKVRQLLGEQLDHIVEGENAFQSLVFEDEEPAATGFEAAEFQATRQSARRIVVPGRPALPLLRQTPFLTTLARRFSMLRTRGPVAPLLLRLTKKGPVPDECHYLAHHQVSCL